MLIFFSSINASNADKALNGLASFLQDGVDIKMAKSQNAKNGNDSTKSKTTIHLDAEYMMALNLLSSAKGASLSGFVQSLVAAHIANLPRKESDAIRALISANTGKTLRIGKGDLVVNEVFEEEEVKRAEVVQTDRISQISRIHTKSTGPVDRAIAIQYGEE